MIIDRKKQEKALNVLWKLHDEAQNAGDTIEASAYAEKAFELLSAFPENQVSLTLPQ